MSMREENRRVLERRAAGLADRIAAAAVPASHVLDQTGAEPTLVVAGVPQHHPRDPRGDAVRFARAATGRLQTAGARRAVVVGLGLGYHLEALAERFDGTIVVVEPDLAVWQLALGARDLSALLTRVEIVANDRPVDGDAGTPTLVVPHAPALLVPGGMYRRALERWQASAAASGLRLRILVASPVYGGSWPIAGYAARALTGLGHDVRLLDLAGFHDGLRHLAVFGAAPERRRALEARYCDALGDGVAAAVEAHQPDLVLALAQAPLGPRALEAIAAAGALRALWFVEDYRRFDYWRAVAPHYDHVFTIQDGACIEAIAAATPGHVTYLPCGFDPTVHRPLPLGAAERAAWGSDVGFVGAGYRNRRLAFRSFLDLDFRIWGSDWENAGDLAPAVQRDGARIDTDDTVRIFGATRINLNLHSSTYHDGVDPRGDFVNPRTFELAGAGAFQIVDARTLLPPLFEAGREIAVAASVREMRALTERYLAHPEARAEIAARGRARALAEHTYRHRMEALLGAVIGRHHERLLGRRRATTTFADVRGRAPEPLRRFLDRFDATAPFTLDRVVATLADRDGALDEPEAIFLFLHQFDELYLREHRARAAS
jgi:spore maturation protein CgeB